MGERRIELNERKSENNLPNSFEVLIEGSMILSGHHYYAVLLDKHFLLKGHSEGHDDDCDLGIEHSIRRAEQRLYIEAREMAEEVGENFKITNLVDNTKYFKRLPRGGK